MAIIRPNGTYLRITSFRTDNNTVEYEIYQNEEARDRELAGTWTEFDVKKNASFNTAVISEIGLEAPVVAFKNAKENTHTIGYALMLADESAFGGATLDQETKDEIAGYSTANAEAFEAVLDFIANARYSTVEEKTAYKAKFA